MSPIILNGLGIGLVLSGILLLAASVFYKQRMRNPALIRWAGFILIVIGSLVGVIASS
jgi:hypothetical protein